MHLAPEDLPFIPRATRFQMPAPVRYRRTGGDVWHEGTLENISRSGAFFRGFHRFDLTTSVELVFELQRVAGEDSATFVVCEGSIVRTTDDPADGGSRAMAMTIERYQLERRKLA